MEFEKKLSRLEAIVSEMDRGDLELEQSLKLFEEGVKISRDCNEQLKVAEQKVKKLIKVDESGDAVTENFDV